MLRNLIKSTIRQAAWSAKTKTIKQILQSRCRRHGKPEYGRFTHREIERIIHQANENIKELMPYFVDHDNIGNYLMVTKYVICAGLSKGTLLDNLTPRALRFHKTELQRYITPSTESIKRYTYPRVFTSSRSSPYPSRRYQDQLRAHPNQQIEEPRTYPLPLSYACFSSVNFAQICDVIRKIERPVVS